MIDAEKIIRALKVFDGQTILYDSLNGEKVTFRDIIDFIEKQSEAISKRDELIMLQRENIDTTHVNNMKLREEIERLTEEKKEIWDERNRICKSYMETMDEGHLYRVKIAELQKQVDELTKQLENMEEQRDRQAYIAEDLIQEKHRWTEQAVKDTAKEIIDDLNSIKPTVRENYGVSELVGVDMAINRVKDLLKRKGVEV